MLFVGLVAIITAGTENVAAITTTPRVDRVFYLSTPNVLSPITPLAGSPAETNFTKAHIEFRTIPILSELTVSGQVTLSLWINSTLTAPTALSLNATVSEWFLGGDLSNDSIVFPQRQLSSGDRQYNFTGTLPPRSLIFGSRILVTIDAAPTATANVTMLWGALSHPSLAILPLSGYATLDTGTPVEILDSLRNPSTAFDLNSTNNVVIFRTRVFLAFGDLDIQRVTVNLTVIGPNLRPVKSGTNLTMTQFPTSGFPYTYATTWVYPSNTTTGTYQVYIDIVDSHNAIAFSFRGPATFVLFRGFFLPPPLDLIPYFAVGVAGALGGVFYYRKRRARSYLAPFDHFNTLTGGELDSGTFATIIGNTGSGKSMLSQQLMYEDLKKGRPCVFVSTGDFPSNIRASMKTMGLDVTGYEQKGLLTFVDGYSSEAGQQSTEKVSIPSLNDLTTLGVKITSSLPVETFKGGSLYFDSLTPLASRAKPESIVALVQSVGARVRGMDGKAFFTIGPSVDEMVRRQLEEIADCVVQMEAFEEGGVRKSRLKIAKFRARKYEQGWVLYTIEDGKGIIFYSKKPKK
jgi:KaiC/GvpD/RAD55 family RecA-like ATPase